MKDSLQRTRLELATTLICVLGGGAVALYTVWVLAERMSPGSTSRPHVPGVLEAVLAITGVTIVFVIGALAGGVLCVLMWAPWSTRQQLCRLAEPDIRPFSSVMRWVIRKVRP